MAGPRLRGHGEVFRKACPRGRGHGTLPEILDMTKHQLVATGIVSCRQMPQFLLDRQILRRLPGLWAWGWEFAARFENTGRFAFNPARRAARAEYSGPAQVLWRPRLVAPVVRAAAKFVSVWPRTCIRGRPVLRFNGAFAPARRTTTWLSDEQESSPPQPSSPSRPAGVARRGGQQRISHLQHA